MYRGPRFETAAEIKMFKTMGGDDRDDGSAGSRIGSRIGDMLCNGLYGHQLCGGDLSRQIDSCRSGQLYAKQYYSTEANHHRSHNQDSTPGRVWVWYSA